MYLNIFDNIDWIRFSTTSKTHLNITNVAHEFLILALEALHSVDIRGHAIIELGELVLLELRVIDESAQLLLHVINSRRRRSVTARRTRRYGQVVLRLRFRAAAHASFDRAYGRSNCSARHFLTFTFLVVCVYYCFISFNLIRGDDIYYLSI